MVLPLLFRLVVCPLLQFQWIAAFYASVRLLRNIWSATTAEADLESCMEALVSGLDLHIKQGIEAEQMDNYLSTVNLFLDRGAELQMLGVLRSLHPKAVDELVFCLRCIENHSLDLSGIKLPVINPTRIRMAMDDLHRIDVSHNRLERLPLELFLLPNLTSLKASHNQLQVLPAFPRWQCTALQVLDVSHNELTCRLGSQDYNDFSEFLPSGSVAKSFLTSGPGRSSSPSEQRKQPSKLRTKLFSTFTGRVTEQKQVKRTTCLPTGIFTMKNLTSVNLRANRFEELPVWVTILPKLWSLDLRDNPELHRLPPELARAKGLFLLRVEGLMLSDLPSRELDRGSKAVVSYLRSQLKMSVSYRHMKLMVIGEIAAGKTSLLTYLTGEMSPNRTHQDELLSTVGVSMGQYKCQRPREGRREVSQPVFFQTLDFAGQHEYDSTHQCFFSLRAVYLGVFDATKGYNGVASLRPWLMSIHACAPGSPVILVGTHCDVVGNIAQDDILSAARHECQLGRATAISSALGLPKIVGLYLVSSVTGEGMDALKEAIYSEAVELTDPHSIFKEPYVQQMVPGSYVELQQRLSKEAEDLKARDCCPVITHEQMLEVVKQPPALDIEDSEELCQACRFLHDVGVLLHYEPPPTKLSGSLYFIEPQWLSNALARIVTTRERSLAYRGLLSLAHLPLIFKDLLVPPSLYPSFMDLLETFEILVPLDKDNTVYLVPALLPKQTEKLPVLGGECCVARVYSLAFIPAGLWTRLIARLVAFFDLQPTSLPEEEDASDGRMESLERHLSAPPTPSAASATSMETLQARTVHSLPTSPSHLSNKLGLIQHSTSPISISGIDSGTARLQEVLEKRRKWHCWQNGGVFYLRETDDELKKCLSRVSSLQSLRLSAGQNVLVEDNFIVAQEGRNVNELVLFVQSTSRQHAAQLLSHTVSQLDTLLAEWYPGLCEDPCPVGLRQHTIFFLVLYSCSFQLMICHGILLKKNKQGTLFFSEYVWVFIVARGLSESDSATFPS